MELLSSHLGLAIQAAGIGLIAVLSLSLRRSLKRDYFDLWSVAWVALTLALLALFVSFRRPQLLLLAQPFYFFGEYAFGGLLVAGARLYATGRRPSSRWLWALVPAATASLVLPAALPEFTLRFIVQAAIMAGLFAAGFVFVERARHARPTGAGARIMSVSLVALTLGFLHYVPVLSYSVLTGLKLPEAYAGYTSLYDLVLEVVLGFGLVAVAMEDVRRELVSTNDQLRDAHDRMETLAHSDPLTGSLNRHAFAALVERGWHERGAKPSGCVAVADLDGLKPLNDRFGHAAGDAAIRVVANALRTVVRADDLVFRWGGDEFLLVLMGLDEHEARRRLEGLETTLQDVTLPGVPEPVALGVSVGVVSLDRYPTLERAIDAADELMYRRKQRAKSRLRPA